MEKQEQKVLVITLPLAQAIGEYLNNQPMGEVRLFVEGLEKGFVTDLETIKPLIEPQKESETKPKGGK